MGKWERVILKYARRKGFAPAALLVSLILLTLLPARAAAAVTITSFTAKAATAQIVVQWKTATEINNSGFNLLRSNSAGGTYTKIMGLMPSANPGSVLGASYSYTDSSVAAGQTFFYKLEAVETGGAKELFGPVSAALADATPEPTAVPAPAATNVPTNVPAPPAGTTVPTQVHTPSATSTSPRQPTALPVANASPTSTAMMGRVLPTPTRRVHPQAAPSSSPTLAQEVIAAAIKPPTLAPAIDSLATASDSQAQNDSPSRAYYLNRLLEAGTILLAAVLMFGSFTLGIIAVGLLVRATRRL